MWKFCRMKSPPSIRRAGWFICDSIKLPYDYLILATGIQYNYFGHDDWQSIAPGLESLDDADLIRGKVLTAFERAEETAALARRDSAEIRQLLTFVLVGGGTVGVEMASTLAEMSRMALKHDFRNIDPRSARILLYEAAPRILPTFPESLSAKAQRHLESLGVEVYANTRVTSIDAGGIVADGKRVPAGTVLWSAGVLASPAGRWLGAAMDRSGKIIVNPDLSVPGHPEIFAIGDTAHVVAESRNLLGIKSKQPMTLPGVAPPAIQEGQYVARLIRRRVAGQAGAGALLVLGQGRSGHRGADVCVGRPALRAVRGISGLDCLGRGAHLFSDRVRESALRRAGMGGGVRDQEAAGPRLPHTAHTRQSGQGALRLPANPKPSQIASLESGRSESQFPESRFSGVGRIAKCLHERLHFRDVPFRTDCRTTVLV